jgi:hypothetical protein
MEWYYFEYVHLGEAGICIPWENPLCLSAHHPGKMFSTMIIGSE